MFLFGICTALFTHLMLRHFHFFPREAFLWLVIIIFLFGLFRLRRYLPRAAIKKTEKWQQSGSGVFLFFPPRNLLVVHRCRLPIITVSPGREEDSIAQLIMVTQFVVPFFIAALYFLQFFEKNFWRGGAAESNPIKKRKTK